MSDSIAQKLPVGWSLKLSSDYCESIADGTHDTPKPIETDGVPLYTSKNLTKFNRLDTDDVYVISKTDAVDINKRSYVEKYDILFGMIGTIGNPVVIETETNQFAVKNVCIFRFNGKKADSLWFYYNLCSEFFESQISRMLDGSTQKFVPLSTLRNFLVPTPANEEQQQKIATILSTVDNLIEKTQSLIDKYTDIKQGIMADLFTRGIDLSKGPDGTSASNPNYGQLRPSFEDAPELYKETELGWVPKEWEVVSLGDIANVDRGKFTHRPRDDSKCYGGTHPFIQTGSVTKAKGGFITDYKQTLSDYGRSVSREFSAGTIAVTIAANIADTGILNIPMCFPDSIVGVNVDELKATIRYVEVSIRRNKQRLDAIAPLSAQKNINLEDLRPLKIALPALQEQIEICKRYEINEELIHNEKSYLDKLMVQKKGLMQDLLTGKVKVV